jgi:hypothetical protein
MEQRVVEEEDWRMEVRDGQSVQEKAEANSWGSTLLVGSALESKLRRGR